MSRGLLGKQNPLQMRHCRKDALKQADLVILAGSFWHYSTVFLN
jgi:acetolactate synthase-like protein